MRRALTRENLFFGLSLVPLAVFLRLAGMGGYTDEAWALSFRTGAALCAGFAVLSLRARVKPRDVFGAAALLLCTGALSFLAGLAPVIDLYREYQGAVFMFWYAALRLALALRPVLFAVWLDDRFSRRRGLAALLAAAAFAWSFFFHRDLLAGTAAPFILMNAALHLACRQPAGGAGARGDEEPSA
ncbi:MAG: hypothetical protein RDU13_02000 [Elusimicrobiales bacterium]|nr:hypothetical protein [Elusimicrobiales bacterium]